MKTFRFGMLMIVMALPQVTHAQSQIHMVRIDPKSATIAESYLRGMADMYRSYGEYLYLRALGATHWQEAYQRYLRNRVLAMRSWQEVRRINDEMRRSLRYQAGAGEVSEFQRKFLPRRLSNAELTANGTIHWPDLLMANEFRQSRERLDRLFWQQFGSTPAAERTAVRKAIQDEAQRMRAVLVKRINDYPTGEFIAATKFIDSLRYEASVVGHTYDHQPLATR